MPKAVDLTDKQFGRLRVVERAHNSPHGKAQWRCICACGKEVLCISGNLVQGVSRSCGCINTERVTKHGLHTTPEYQAWADMKTRCTCATNKSFRNYGGRGISYCPSWEEFSVFITDMGVRPSPQHTLDRIDNNKGYSANNCRWVVMKTQQRNKRSNVFALFNGEEKCISTIAEDNNVSYGALLKRIKKGESVESAVNTLRTKKRRSDCRNTATYRAQPKLKGTL